jgi:hypothetical protein
LWPSALSTSTSAIRLSPSSSSCRTPHGKVASRSGIAGALPRARSGACHADGARSQPAAAVAKL